MLVGEEIEPIIVLVSFISSSSVITTSQLKFFVALEELPDVDSAIQKLGKNAG